jgi:RNA polymerase sigma factor (sigma-70 family)
MDIHIRGSDPDSPELVHRLGSDPDAFEAFYRRHVADVGRFVARRVPDPHTAADVTAEVFLAVIDGAARYRGGPGGARGWLFGIARNLAAADSRRSARDRRTESRVSGRRLLDADDLARAEERIDAARRVTDLAPGLAALPPGERAVLELVALDGLTVAEAARVLGIAVADRALAGDAGPGLRADTLTGPAATRRAACRARRRHGVTIRAWTSRRCCSLW